MTKHTPTPDRAARSVKTPVGDVVVVANPDGVESIDLVDAGKGDAIAQSLDNPNATCAPLDYADEAAQQVVEYFTQKRTSFRIKLAPRGTPFSQAVWHELAKIPFGKTVTYGELATRVGRPSAARAIGRAVGANPLPIVIPCHRVLAANGALGGFSCGIDRKLTLLRHEGVHVEDPS